MEELTAYHEAGHAVMAMLLGAKVLQVTIEPDRDDGPERYGDTQIAWQKNRWPKREYSMRCVQVSLAGPIVEMIYSGEPYHPALTSEWADDWRQAWREAANLEPDERRRLKGLEQICKQLYELLRADDYWAAIAALADHLLAHETLQGEEIEEIVGPWLEG